MAFILPLLSTHVAEVLLLLVHRRKETTDMNWKGLAGAAAMAVLACGASAFASESNQNSASNVAAMIPNYLDDTTTTAPAAAPAPAASAPSETTLTPIMFLLDPTPVGQWL